MTSDDAPANEDAKTPDASVMGLVISLAMAAIGAAFFATSFGLPDPKFDPVGPSGLPKIASAILILLCLGVAATEFVRHKNRTAPSGDAGDSAPRSIRPAVTFGALSVAYIAALSWLTLGFGWTTFIFLYVGGLLLAPISRNTLIGLAVLAAVVAFGSEYVFGTLLTLIMPGSGQ